MAVLLTSGTLVRHKDQTDSYPITDQDGTFTTCESLAEIIGYTGMNWEEEATKDGVLSLIGHPIMIRNFLDMMENVADINALGSVAITRDSFPPLSQSISSMFEAEKQGDKVARIAGTSITDARRMYPATSHVQLLSAGLWHWSEDLKQVREYNSGRISKFEIRWVYSRLDKVKPGVLDEEFRNVHPMNWPIGLQEGKLEANGETGLELFNRLWQLFWFMKDNVFEISCKKRWQLPGHDLDIYGADTKDAHPPVWWFT